MILRRGVPVVPGYEQVTEELPDCAACKRAGQRTAHTVVEGIEMALCIDASGCAAYSRTLVTT
jgi:hypothetical protein